MGSETFEKEVERTRTMLEDSGFGTDEVRYFTKLIADSAEEFCLSYWGHGVSLRRLGALTEDSASWIFQHYRLQLIRELQHPGSRPISLAPPLLRGNDLELDQIASRRPKKDRSLVAGQLLIFVFTDPSRREDVLGDLEETHARAVKRLGPGAARRIYYLEVVRSIMPVLGRWTTHTARYVLFGWVRDLLIRVFPR